MHYTLNQFAVNIVTLTKDNNKWSCSVNYTLTENDQTHSYIMTINDTKSINKIKEIFEYYDNGLILQDDRFGSIVNTPTFTMVVDDKISLVHNDILKEIIQERYEYLQDQEKSYSRVGILSILKG